MADLSSEGNKVSLAQRGDGSSCNSSNPTAFDLRGEEELASTYYGLHEQSVDVQLRIELLERAILSLSASTWISPGTLNN
jgi:hypothetical protein